VGKIIKKLKRPVVNVKTGRSHSAWLQTLVAAVCWLLIHFDIVPADKLTGEAVTQIVILLGVLIMLWRTYVAPFWKTHFGKWGE